MSWFDCGVNLFSRQFADKHSNILARAQAAGVEGCLLIASDLAECQLNLALLNGPDECVNTSYSTAGVHPHQAANLAADWLLQLRQLLQQPKVLALGECGLDFNRDFSPRHIQQLVFAEQLALAKACDKAVYLHERDAFELQLSMLREQQINRGIAHCFTGDTVQLAAYLDQGLYIGITGWLCDEKRNQQLAQALQYLPLDRLLLETDAPYLLPRNIRPRPKYNEPALLPYIAQEVAQRKGVSLEALAAQCRDNFQQLFFAGSDLATERTAT
ncbi:TatD family hydrolase [Arsukibacterium sp.]|uniref:TatD family hydrolase n=1 Tax=Arsukibacterium sp. TaxID=1977258 RepID=UPI002FDAC84C